MIGRLAFVKFAVNAGFLAGGIFFSALGVLPAQTISATGSGEIIWHPYGVVHNESSALNPGNYLYLQNLVNAATATYWFDAFWGDSLQLSGNFEIAVNNKRGERLLSVASNEDYSSLGDVSLGFKQLYLEWTTRNYWNFGYGKHPLRYGYSRVYSPLNYTARILDFRSTLGQWNGWFKGNIGMVNFAVNYLPAITFRDEPNNRTDVERFFASMESLVDRQSLIVSLSGFFFDSLDTSLFFNLQDKGHYGFEDFYIAAGGGFSWSILDKLIWRAEFLYGNGYDDLKVLRPVSGLSEAIPQQEYVERNLDAYYVKFLTGITVSLPGDIELSAEYYHNGAGLTSATRKYFIDALNISGDSIATANGEDLSIVAAHRGFLSGGIDNWQIYELGQHYAFLQLQKLHIFQHLDCVNSSILLIDDLSFVNITALTYTFSDNFSLGAEARFFLFQENGAYSLSPETFRLKFEAIYSF